MSGKKKGFVTYNEVTSSALENELDEIETEELMDKDDKPIKIDDLINHFNDEQLNNKLIEIMCGKELKITDFNNTFFKKYYKKI